MAVSKANVLNLYKNLIKEANKYPIYNYRMYALRRIRDAFKENSKLSAGQTISEKYKEGNDSLELIKRQVTVSSLYKTEKLVIE